MAESVDQPNPPNTSQTLAPSAVVQSSVQLNQNNDYAALKLMLEQMQQEIITLRSKIDGSGTSNTPRGQNVGSSSPVIQIGTPSIAPNAAVTIGAPVTTSTGASSNYITEERLHELLKSEAERASKVVATVHFQPPYLGQVTSKPYPKDYVKPKFNYLMVKEVVLGSM